MTAAPTTVPSSAIPGQFASQQAAGTSAVFGGGRGQPALPGLGGLLGQFLAVLQARLGTPAEGALPANGQQPLLPHGQQPLDMAALPLQEGQLPLPALDQDLLSKLFPEGVDLSALMGEQGAGAQAEALQVAHTQLSVVITEIEVAITQLQEQGISLEVFGDAKELAGALENLGMPSKDAQIQAVRMTAMLDAVAIQLSEKGGAQDLPSLLQAAKVSVQPQAIKSVQKVIHYRQVSVQYQQVQQQQPIDVVAQVQRGEPLMATSSLQPAPQVMAQQAAPAVAQVVADVAKPVLPNGQHANGIEFKAPVGEQPQLSQARAVEPVVPSVAQTAAADVVKRPVDPMVMENDFVNITQAQASPAGRVGEISTNPIQIGNGVEVFRWTSNARGMEFLQRVTPQEALPQAALDPNLQQLEAEGDAAQSSGATSAMGNASARTAQGSTQVSFSHLMSRANVGGQVQVNIRNLAQQGGGEVKIQLDPPELGPVKISLQIIDGSVKGMISATNPDVIEQMARELHHLKQGLTDAGLNLDQEGISFMVAEDDGDQGGQQQEQAEQSDAEALLAEAEENGEPWRDPERLLDTHA